MSCVKKELETARFGIKALGRSTVDIEVFKKN